MRARNLCSATLVLATLGTAAGSATANYSRIETSPGLHRFVVWIDPAGEDHPMTGAEVASYCGAAEQLALHTWDASNGRHTVYQVFFHYGDQPVGEYDATWHRRAGTASANLGGGHFNMYDGIVMCTHGWENIGGQLQTVLIDEPCPTGLTCELGGTLHRERCIDATAQYVPNSPETVGFTMAHESYHSHYGLSDQYGTPDGHPSAYGFRFCSDDTTDVSAMADWKRGHWCDHNTHNYERIVDGLLGSESNLIGYNDWVNAKMRWVNLMDYNPGATYTGGDYFTNPVAPLVLPPTSEPFCVFGGDAYNNNAVSDVMVVIDRSGSMDYTAPRTVITAFEGAFAAGLEHYNLTPAGRYAGVSSYNTAVQQLQAYGPRPPGTYVRPSDYPSLTASGGTDICVALEDGGNQIRSSGTSSAVAQILLLSDGMPTATGCNTKQQVLDAAYDVCHPADPSAIRVGISTVAYGDADYSLLNEITNLCGGEVRSVDHASPEDPMDLQVAVSRLAYETRNYQDALFVKRPVESLIKETFEVAQGTTKLEVAWIGESFDARSVLHERENVCAFEDYHLKLIGPSGSGTGTALVPKSVEDEYFTRTLTVPSPKSGTWTMLLKTDSPCREDNPKYTEYVPKVAMLAEVQNNHVKGELTLSSHMIALNEQSIIKARLDLGDYSSMTQVDVVATAHSEGGVRTAVPMNDDGTGEDERADDGIYTGVFNGDCKEQGSPDPGARRIVVTMNSEKSVAKSVLRPAFDIVPTADITPPVTASIVLEKSLYVKPCETTGASCWGVVSHLPPKCDEPRVVLPAGVSVTPGQTVCGIQAIANGLHLGTRGVSIGAGPGLTVSKIRSVPDDNQTTTELTFCVTADSNAPNNVEPLCVQYGDTVECASEGIGVKRGVRLDLLRKNLRFGRLGNVSFTGLFRPSRTLSLRSSEISVNDLLSERGDELASGVPMRLTRVSASPWFARYVGDKSKTVAMVFNLPFLGYVVFFSAKPSFVDSPAACLDGRSSATLSTALTLSGRVSKPVTTQATEAWRCPVERTLERTLDSDALKAR